MGGEPTFTSRLHPEAPEWNGDALGATKWEQGVALAEALRARLAPGGVILHRYGKHYPGESLPRWALDIIGRRDGVPLVKSRASSGAGTVVGRGRAPGVDALAARLGVAKRSCCPRSRTRGTSSVKRRACPSGSTRSAPTCAIPRSAAGSRALLDRGLATEAGFVLPLSSAKGAAMGGGVARSRVDVPARAPLPRPGRQPDRPPPAARFDRGRRPRRRRTKRPTRARPIRAAAISPTASPSAARLGHAEAEKKAAVRAREPQSAPRHGVRTALCVEPRDGRLFVFLPPLTSAGALPRPRARNRRDLGGARSPASSSRAIRRRRRRSSSSIAVTPDPGVLEVNIPPTRTSREHVALMETVFDAALHAGLHAEKYQLDGRQAGSGGGNHLTLGGPTPLASPFVQRPDLLASLITFVQHHPSLSYLFTGLFVGPTSQAPRLDEARHDSLYELEIALARAFERGAEPPLAVALRRALPPPARRRLGQHPPRRDLHRQALRSGDAARPAGPRRAARVRDAAARAHGGGAGGARARARRVVRARAVPRAARALGADAPRPLPPADLAVARLRGRARLPRARGPPAARARRTARSSSSAARSSARSQASDVRLELRNAIEPWHVLGEEMTTDRHLALRRLVDGARRGAGRGARARAARGHRERPRPAAASDGGRGRARGRRALPRLGAAAQPAPAPRHPPSAALRRRSTPGPSARSARAPTTCGTPRGAATTRRRSRASRRAPGARSASPSRAAVAVAGHPRPARPHPDAPYTLDLRRFAIDHPMPEPDDEASPSVKNPQRDGTRHEHRADRRQHRSATLFSSYAPLAGTFDELFAAPGAARANLRPRARRAPRRAPRGARARAGAGRALAAQPGRDVLGLRRPARRGEDLPLLPRAARRRGGRLARASSAGSSSASARSRPSSTTSTASSASSRRSASRPRSCSAPSTTCRSCAACARRAACASTSPGIDLIRDPDGAFRVLEDNLRTPSGVSYVMENRLVTKRVFPTIFDAARVRRVDHYPAQLAETLRSACARRTRRPARRRAHAGAVQLGLLRAQLPRAHDGHRARRRRPTSSSTTTRSSCARRAACGASTSSIAASTTPSSIPEVFRPDSLLGVPGLMRAYAKGNVDARQRARQRRRRRQGGLRVRARR